MLKIFLLIPLVSLLTIISQIFLKKGLIKIGGIEIGSFSELSESFLKLIQEKYILTGFLIALIAAFTWLIIISKKDLTLAFPVAGGIFYVLLFLSSWLFLGENITVWKIIGTAIILIGISIILK